MASTKTRRRPRIERTLPAFSRAVRDAIDEAARRKLKPEFVGDTQKVVVPVQVTVTFRRNTAGARRGTARSRRPKICCRCYRYPDGVILCIGSCCVWNP